MLIMRPGVDANRHTRVTCTVSQPTKPRCIASSIPSHDLQYKLALVSVAITAEPLPVEVVNVESNRKDS